MKSTLKILKDNVFTIVVIIVFIIGMFALSYLKRIYWDNNNQAIYGNRTDGIENHYISDSDIDDIEKNIGAIEKVEKVVYDLEGRIINLTITVSNDLSVKDAKKLSGSILENFTEEQLSYYSIQIYFVKDDSSLDDFPIMGYKHYSNDGFSWTKDREATENEN